MEEQKNPEEITLSKVELASWQLGQYVRIIAWPVVLAQAFSIVYVLMNRFFDFVWVVNVLAFAYISHIVVQKHQGHYQQAVISNLIAGLVMGFIFALFKLIWQGSFYLFFNLIVEPILTALVGLAVAVVAVYLYSILPLKNKSLVKSLKDNFNRVCRAKLDRLGKGGGSMPQKPNTCPPTASPSGDGRRDKTQDKDIEENKLVAAFGYVWILCLVPLFAKKDSKFAQFHGKQGLILFIVEIVGMLVFWIPVVGWILAIIVIVLAVLGIVQALQGRYWEMPVIGPWAKKINL